MSGYLQAVARTLAGAAKGLKRAPVLLFVLGLCCALIGGIVVLSTGDVAVLAIVVGGVVMLGVAGVIAWAKVERTGRHGVNQSISARGHSRVTARRAQRVTGAGKPETRQSIRARGAADVDADDSQQVDDG